MVKITDGSNVLASELLSGTAEDDNGNKLKFEEIPGSSPATFRAEGPLNDNTGRVNIFTFSIANTSVRVSMVQQTQEQFQATKRAQADRERLERSEATTTKQPPQQTTTGAAEDNIGNFEASDLLEKEQSSGRLNREDQSNDTNNLIEEDTTNNKDTAATKKSKRK